MSRPASHAPHPTLPDSDRPCRRSLRNEMVTSKRAQEVYRWKQEVGFPDRQPGSACRHAQRLVNPRTLAAVAWTAQYLEVFSAASAAHCNGNDMIKLQFRLCPAPATS